MKKGSIEFIDSDKDTHFTGALGQNAMEIESIGFPTSWQNLQINEVEIEGISVQSDQNLEWDIFIFSKAGADDTNLDDDTFVHHLNFSQTSGKQIAGANQYYYPCPVGLMAIPYKDIDNTRKIHIGLINRSVTSKTAGATGEIKIRLSLRPIFA